MLAGRVLLFLVLAAGLAVAFGVYVNYRNDETAKVAHITSLAQIEGVAPTACAYPVGVFGTGSGGQMYIANGRLRIDIPDLQTNDYAGSVEAILGVDGTRLIDPDSLRELSGGKGVAYALNMVITQAPWKCIPWWFSDAGKFTIPNAVAF